VSILQRSTPVEASPGVPATRGVSSAYRAFLRELATFGFVGFIGTVISIGGANVMRHGMHAGPVISVVIPTIISTLTSYLLNRHWTFRHRESEGSGREVAVFFGLNGVGMGIQAGCTGFTYYTLGLNGTLSYNVALLVGLGLASAFRYWSYRRFVFTPVAA
jgi:putative flippase GtrA